MGVGGADVDAGLEEDLDDAHAGGLEDVVLGHVGDGLADVGVEDAVGRAGEVGDLRGHDGGGGGEAVDGGTDLAALCGDGADGVGDAATLLRLLTCIVVIMVLGFWLGGSLQQHLGIVLPSYVGAMFVAIILRNLNDRTQAVEMPDHAVSTIGDVCLGMFLTMAMMSLKFWELEKLGLPLLVILVVQVVIMILLCVFVLFRLLGAASSLSL